MSNAKTQALKNAFIRAKNWVTKHPVKTTIGAALAAGAVIAPVGACAAGVVGVVAGGKKLIDRIIDKDWPHQNLILAAVTFGLFGVGIFAGATLDFLTTFESATSAEIHKNLVTDLAYDLQDASVEQASTRTESVRIPAAWRWEMKTVSETLTARVYARQDPFYGVNYSDGSSRAYTKLTGHYIGEIVPVPR